MINILIVDPSRSIRTILKEHLEYEGYRVQVADNSARGKQLCESSKCDLLLCGMEELPTNVRIPWIRLSANKDAESREKAKERGAFDSIPKPINLNQVLAAVKNCAEKINSGVKFAEPYTGAFSDENETAPAAVANTGEEIIGDSESMRHLRQLIDKVAPSGARVLIMGDNGTGKELVARRLHHKSTRSGRPFVEVNCAAIPSELIESELFGHEKGAFTSAIKQRKGKFEQANGGTLFLDEIGDMSLSAQAKVLRVLQEKKVSRVGSDADIDVNVRVVAATNKYIPAEIEKGNFREDLFHRLSVIIINVPSLADHAEDIPALTEHFLDVLCKEYKIPRKHITPEALATLQSMPWTGNIRELRNVVERLVILCDKEITEEDVTVYAVNQLKKYVR